MGWKAGLVALASMSALANSAGGANLHQWQYGEILQLPAARPSPALEHAKAGRSCESLAGKSLSETAVIREARVMAEAGGAGDWCRATIEIKSPNDSNPISVWLALPLENWNGRFLGVGGGGWVSGVPLALALGSGLGFATAVTNAGRPYDLTTPPDQLIQMLRDNSYLLNAEGHLDWTALQNFAYRGIHEMTVFGKAATAEFYGTKARYSYFTGCSTGGRQGQSEVQRYPGDYDGVLSGAPAINWAHLEGARFWPATVMSQIGAVPQCKFDAAHRAAVAACDAADGVRDGMIESVGTCHFDSKALLGTKTECGEIDSRDVEVIKRIWDGPRRVDGTRLWSGIDEAALINLDANSTGWAPALLDGKQPDAQGLTYAAYEDLFDQIVERYGAVLDTSNPDLRAFAAHGGKTIIWHGVADDTLEAAGSVHYVQAVRQRMGVSQADKFLRFYLAPGISHCQGGDGPHPVALFQSLMDWVERGQAPDAAQSRNVDEAGRVTRSRPLCPYPQHAQYQGHGSTDEAANFRCAL